MTRPTMYRLGERAPTLPADGDVYVAPGAVVVGDVRIGDGVSIWFNAVLRGDNEPITLGAGSNVQDGCVVHTDPGYPVEIGENVTIGHNAIVHGCIIGNGSLIGMGATVLNGARIGERCLVGANSLVREGMVVPDGSLVIGIPAKIVKALHQEAAARLSGGAARYRSKAASYPLELEPIDL
ncbi:gamma carbonic anhydrase family protein [Arvimicrobium flavum]|uniref:gamma carbonic anhydrase family protein n=1 Tax=Arvimicrobium flavum TaxID=3393320 RepID=UPI00237AAC59|nr:gamma carbonic anhydrase family protein [Mesorhizobium shangrilense]